MHTLQTGHEIHERLLLATSASGTERTANWVRLCTIVVSGKSELIHPKIILIHFIIWLIRSHHFILTRIVMVVLTHFSSVFSSTAVILVSGESFHMGCRYRLNGILP